MSRFQLTAALGICAALALAGSASAAGSDANDRVVVIIKTTDAELHTPSGARALAQRIRIAAGRACGSATDPVWQLTSTWFIQCREAAIDRAIKNLDAPLVADALGRAPQVLARSR